MFAAGALVAASGIVDPRPSLAQATADLIKKVVSGATQHGGGVDNGWTIYGGDGVMNQPVFRWFTRNAVGDFIATGTVKLKTSGSGEAGAGGFFLPSGIKFAETNPGQGQSQLAETGGISGVGLGFGEVTTGGAGGSIGGWVNDVTVKARFTNPDLALGAINAMAVDPVNGAYAVGDDADAPPFVRRAIVMRLNSTAKTYVPISTTILAPLGGQKSSALGISKGASFVVGVAEDAALKEHAVYAPIAATAWIDLASLLPADAVKSCALVANDAGFIAGTVTINRQAGDRVTNVEDGFVYNVNTNTMTVYSVPTAHVDPQAVLADGKVVGGLKVVLPLHPPPGTQPPHHSYLFDGANVTDYGTMTLATTGQPAYGCRVTQANAAGEMVGSCVAGSTDPYSSAVRSFYIDAAGPSPSYVDLNAVLHSRLNTLVTAIKPLIFTNEISIDDQQEILLAARKTVGGTTGYATYLISKNAYK